MDESYFRAEEERHLAECREAIPHLTMYSTSMEEKQLRGRMLIDFAKLQGARYRRKIVCYENAPVKCYRNR